MAIILTDSVNGVRVQLVERPACGDPFLHCPDYFIVAKHEATTRIAGFRYVGNNREHALAMFDDLVTNHRETGPCQA